MNSENISNYGGVQAWGNAQVNAGAVAGGPGASATADNVTFTDPAAGLAELRDLLGSLAEQLRVPPPEVENPGGLQAIVGSAQQEAAKGRPNMGLLSGLLHALMAGAGGVTSLATAITAAQHVISSFL
jgi:hypothetical protein